MARRTIAGILPDAWEANLIKDICKVVRGSSPRPAGDPKYFDGDYLPWVTVADLTRDDSMYLDKTRSHLTAEGAERTRITEAGTLMLTNSGATLGVPKISRIKCGANDGVAMLLKPKGIAAEFAYYYLLSKTNYFREVLAPGVGQPNLNTEIIGDFPIPTPPLPEQRKIAQILSTWDHAITATERLLENSQQRKKGLMQQLLTGKKRLPGFEGEWEATSLGDIGEISSAGVDKKVIDGERSVRLLNYLDVFRREYVYNKEITHTVSAPDQKVFACDVRKGDVFFTPSSETRDEVGISAVAAEDMPGVVYSYHVVRLRPSHSLDPNFAAYAFQTDKFRKQAYRLCDGSGQRYVLSQDDFRSIRVKLPQLEEQQAIGRVLKSASDEIAALGERLDCLKQEKKALMQQLLTGNRRVQVEAA